MWKCSPAGSSTRNASTVSIWIQYDAWYPAASQSGDRPENRSAIASPTKANDRSCAIPGSAGALSAKRKPSNRKSVTMIAAISDRIRSASRLRSSRGGFLHEPPPERVTDGKKHGKLDEVLEAREHSARQSGIDEAFVVADHEQLHFAREQRHEAEEDHRVHRTRLPLARDHARLQEAVDQHGSKARQRMVPAHLRGQLHDDGELAPCERAEARQRDREQQRDRDRVHEGMGAGFYFPIVTFPRVPPPESTCPAAAVASPGAVRPRLPADAASG